MWKKFSEEKPRDGSLILVKHAVGIFCAHHVGVIDLETEQLITIRGCHNCEYPKLDFERDKWQEVEE